jgi:hypothetical protein
VAVVVLGILDTLAAGTAFSLLGIAVIALGIAALQRSGS